MTSEILLVVAVACAALLSFLSCAWLEARDAVRAGGPIALCVLIDGAMDATACVPIGLAICSDSVSFLAAGVVGSMIGTWLGLRRYRRRLPRADARRV